MFIATKMLTKSKRKTKIHLLLFFARVHKKRKFLLCGKIKLFQNQITILTTKDEKENMKKKNCNHYKMFITTKMLPLLQLQ